jgi:hypothetical protein
VIEIDGARPGHPLLVKVAYHPGWHTDDGSTIDLVAPGMMLVTPRSPHVTLRWSAGLAGTIGIVLTIAALVALVAFTSMPGARMRSMSERQGLVWCVTIVVIAAAFITFALVTHPPVAYGDLLASAQRAAAAKDFTTADRLYQRLLAAPDRHHALRDDAGVYYALSAEEAGRPADAEARWRAFLTEFPVSTFRSEVYVRLARLLRAGGHAAEARDALERALEQPLAEQSWLDQAKAELAELPAS